MAKIREDFRPVFAGAGGGELCAPQYAAFAGRWGWYKIIDELAEHRLLDFDRVAALPAAAVFTHLLYGRERRVAEKAQQALEKALAKRRGHADS
ncbi:hypothetical protein [uncultured Alistipes sp.]|uniref:hypothetical protein n=1 Tax=uncultured Alistipes sp. TaxID=538949 RepID=UPI0026ED7E99|nr:hypothetical protein [uncultured Alistipes sp.]